MITPEDVRLFEVAGPSRKERGGRRRVWAQRQGDLFAAAAPGPVDGAAPELRDGVAPLADDVELFAGAGGGVVLSPYTDECAAGLHLGCPKYVAARSMASGRSCDCHCHQVDAVTTYRVSLFDAGMSHRSMAPDPTTVHHLRLALGDYLPPAYELLPGELPQREANRREAYHLLVIEATNILSAAEGQALINAAVQSIAARAVTRCSYSEPVYDVDYRQVTP